MDLSSWIRRSFSRSSRKTQRYPDLGNPSNLPKPQLSAKEDDDELLGVTEQLIDQFKSFTVETFKNFPLHDDEAATDSYGQGNTSTSSSSNLREDLSDWQEKHAVLVLSKSKELSQLRFKLCPRHMKEHQFWKIYFKLVKTHVSKYELRAIQRAKMRMAVEEYEKASERGGYEVEMVETKQAASSASSTP